MQIEQHSETPSDRTTRVKMAAAALLPLMAIGFGAPVAASDAAHPTVVELYQSQGCSSCPPAIQNINVIAQRPDILALTFAVTYWDQLGWKDTFARPEFTERQSDYDRVGGIGEVATPQTIVNGRATTNGGNGRQLRDTIRAADRGVSGPVIAATAGKITIGAANAAQPATIWLVRYDPPPVERANSGWREWRPYARPPQRRPFAGGGRKLARLGNHHSCAVRRSKPTNRGAGAVR